MKLVTLSIERDGGLYVDGPSAILVKPFNSKRSRLIVAGSTVKNGFERHLVARMDQADLSKAHAPTNLAALVSPVPCQDRVTQP